MPKRITLHNKISILLNSDLSSHQNTNFKFHTNFEYSPPIEWTQTYSLIQHILTFLK